MNLAAAILVASQAIRVKNPTGASQTAEVAAEAVYEGLAERAATLGLEREWQQLSS